jgi:hypothetical protein
MPTITIMLVAVSNFVKIDVYAAGVIVAYFR